MVAASLPPAQGTWKARFIALLRGLSDKPITGGEPEAIIAEWEADRRGTLKRGAREAATEPGRNRGA
jgi:hypothetical protein